jgi:glycerate kinase
MIDEQTSYGKTISGVLKIAAKQKIPVVALAGSVGSLEKLHSIGLTSAFSICNEPLNPEIAMEQADELIFQTTEQICRLIQAKS